jgi:SAM-dependent methyltransferase
MSVALYGQALSSPTDDVLVRSEDGDLQRLPAARWVAPVDEVDGRVIARVHGPALDIGCGPGRLVAALAERGIPVLGIDIAPTAVLMTQGRGGSALQRDVFGRVPAVGRWTWALLLDGNIGIGGSPVKLLRRTGELLAPDGRVLVEVDPPGSPCRTRRVRLETPHHRGEWFDWSWLSADCVQQASSEAGLRVTNVWCDDDRCFAELARSNPSARKAWS